MEKCNHQWIYQYPVCCGHKLFCTKCTKITKVKLLIGNPLYGDPMMIDEERDIAERIGTEISF